MSESPTIPPLFNTAMKRVLRSPMHGMVSKTIMLITFTGRKTGTTYTTPISYSQCGDEVVAFTHGRWWRNLRGGAPVTLRIRGRDVQGQAEAVVDKAAMAEALAAHLKQVPMDATFYHVTFDQNKNPRAEEVRKAVESAVMIRVHLC